MTNGAATAAPASARVQIALSIQDGRVVSAEARIIETVPGGTVVAERFNLITKSPWLCNSVAAVVARARKLTGGRR